MPADPLAPEALLRRLPARRELARRVVVLAECASSNDWLRAHLEEGLLVAAEHQTGGRGRRERDWWSGPPGSNLALSLAIVPLQPPEALGLLAACALAAALRPFTAARAALKWPNDVLLDGAKVAGLLVEVPAARPPLALLGLGVNVHATPPAGLAPYPTTAVHAGLDAAPIGLRTDLLALWLLHFERRLSAFRHGGPEELERDFLALLRAWAPRGVRPAAAAAPAGKLLEFSVSKGLTWGEPEAPVTRPLGLIPALEPLP